MPNRAMEAAISARIPVAEKDDAAEVVQLVKSGERFPKNRSNKLAKP